MNIITLDFETYYDNDYTLSKMTTEAYVRDPRFEVHGVGIKCDQFPATWYDYATDADIGASLNYRFDAIDWANTACLMHHAPFDGLILSHHYGIKPALIYDTLSMARLLIGNHLSASLESLAQHFGLGAKTIDYQSFRGLHWNEMSPAVQQMLANGCCQDVELTYQLFLRLLQGDTGAVQGS